MSRTDGRLRSGSAAQMHVLEALLAVPFAGVFMAIAVHAWNELGEACAPLLAPAIIVLPMAYLVLLLMLRQHGEHRERGDKATPDGGESRPPE